LAADRVPVGQELQRISRCRIDIVCGHKVFAEIDVLTFEVSLHKMRSVLVQLQRERLRQCLEIANGLRRVELEVDTQMRGSLRRVSIRPQRNGEV